MTFFTPIILRSSVPGSSRVTAATTMSAKKSFSPDTSLLLRLVDAHLTRRSRFSASDRPSRETESSWTLAAARAAAWR
jgi:hypothetical protein